MTVSEVEPLPVYVPVCLCRAVSFKGCSKLQPSVRVLVLKCSDGFFVVHVSRLQQASGFLLPPIHLLKCRLCQGRVAQGLRSD